ncbi:uncharacterized protein LOC128132335 [Lactuca sativa]|uniref:uncharacterized protein LOC128132335 n=1 Tax=Lactuca sativa TaxID=4236 RepID=UPI0022AF55D0|nr:uncharacterized protein LOC128132335 [Lactuca sativa]
MKKARYHEMLRSDIRQFVSRSSYKTLDDMIARARERKIDLEMEKKRKPEAVSSTSSSGKKPKVSDSRSKSQQSHGRCGKCGRLHNGVCKAGSSGCYKCSRTRHLSKDCMAPAIAVAASDLICFQCNQRGHKKSQCPSLAAVGKVVAPAPATLRITDGRQGRAEAPVAKSRVFQMTTEEVRATPDVVTGSFSVNDIPAMVLFDSGATRSFVSLVLSKRFSRAPGELDCPLEVEIADDRTVRVARVHRGCSLQLFDEQFSVDLVPIPLRGNKVIVGVDWISPNGAVIDCELQLVRVRTPSGGELVIQGERPQRGPTFCSAARARRYFQQGCAGYVAYVLDAREKGKTIVDDVPIVRDFPDCDKKEWLETHGGARSEVGWWCNVAMKTKA